MNPAFEERLKVAHVEALAAPAETFEQFTTWLDKLDLDPVRTRDPKTRAALKAIQKFEEQVAALYRAMGRAPQSPKGGDK